jgi:hypothetical protein
MAINENRLVIPLEVAVWLGCTIIALGSYEGHFDIEFWPGFITWGVFLAGVIYFILLILAKIFG